jgi:hypothetical protein
MIQREIIKIRTDINEIEKKMYKDSIMKTVVSSDS